MPYHVSWMKDGRVRRFAYPHAHIETALGFASEILNMDYEDVWISDERGQKVADRQAIADYAAAMDDDATDEAAEN